MNTRSEATIDIKRKGQVGAVKTVLITERSVRRFMLMQEDFIRLEFSLDTAVHFAIGDYVNDIFGLFVITEEQMPKFNNTTGGYDYSLRFDKDYMAGKQWINCLIANGQRMESRWSLTDKLEAHAQQIADNYNVFATTRTIIDPVNNTRTYESDGYAVDVTAENANEVKFLSYDGIDIIESMKRIAEKWECEWWVTDEEKVIGDTTYKHTIHFGKCEAQGNRYDLRLGENVESMDVSRDQQTYANRIFAYGGTQNVPESYDRSLILDATNVEGNSTLGYTFYDVNRLVTGKMINGVTTLLTVGFSLAQQGLLTASSAVLVGSNMMYADDYTLADGNAVMLRWDWGAASRPSGTKTVSVKITFGDKVIAYNLTLTELQNTFVDANGYSTWECVLDADEWIFDDVLQRGKFHLAESAEVSLKIEWTLTGFTNYNSLSFESLSGVLTATGSDNTASKEIQVIYNGTEYSATFNPNHHYGDAEGSKIRFSNAVSDFQQGDKVTIPEEHLNTLEVPYSFLSVNYEVVTIGLLGERRLHLPLEDYPNRYIELTEQADMGKVVEQVVAFDNIFPKMALKVSEVSTEEKTEDITHDDESVERQQWTQYKIKATKDNGDSFTFSTRYIMDGCRLQAVFTYPQSPVSGVNYMLAGMTFEVGFDNDTQVFTIVRNEDFGSKLPNGLLKPGIGDTFFLTGWNPKAIGDLTIISSAEDEIKGKSISYLQALHDGQFTFTCRLMSQWTFDLCAQRFYVNNEVGDNDTSNDLPFFVNNIADDENVGNNLAFYVSNGYTEYALPLEGTPVRVWHDALPDQGNSQHYKDSRVIGYEVKMDMPFDTPTYTIGETEAYSRLKKIERELTKL